MDFIHRLVSTMDKVHKHNSIYTKTKFIFCPKNLKLINDIYFKMIYEIRIFF
jgi:hypothetical protein